MSGSASRFVSVSASRFPGRSGMRISRRCVSVEIVATVRV